MAVFRHVARFRLHHPPYCLREQMLNYKPYRESQRLYSYVERELGLEPFSAVLLPVTEVDRTTIVKLLKAEGISPEQRYLVMHLGAKRETNRWPVERYIQVANEITS